MYAVCSDITNLENKSHMFERVNENAENMLNSFPRMESDSVFNLGFFEWNLILCLTLVSSPE